MADIQKIIDDIKTLTIVEVSDLVKKLEEEFGVSAAAPVATAITPAVAVAPAEEEKTEFDIILKDVGANKIAVIKVVREIKQIGLSDAKALVDNAPSTIKENVPTEEAKAIETKFKEAGATVELK